jgi:ABC-type sugar transport system, permease component
MPAISESLEQHSTGKFIAKTILYIVLIVLAVACFLPFYIMIMYSTHTNSEIATSLWLTPGTNFIENFNRLSTDVNIIRGFLNSVFVAVAVTVVGTYFSALTAYGFSCYKFKGNKVLYWIVLGTMMIPGQLGIIGFYQLCTYLHILNTYIPLILPSIATAGSVFFIKGYTDGAVQSSLLESARIDGCSEFHMFHKIALPLMMPSLATMGIFSFIGAWNNYLSPMLLLSSPDAMTLPVLIVLARGTFAAEFGAIYCGIAISVIPIMIVFIIFSKQIVDGLTIGGVKG